MEATARRQGSPQSNPQQRPAQLLPVRRSPIPGHRAVLASPWPRSRWWPPSGRRAAVACGLQQRSSLGLHTRISGILRTIWPLSRGPFSQAGAPRPLLGHLPSGGLCHGPQMAACCGHCRCPRRGGRPSGRLPPTRRRLVGACRCSRSRRTHPVASAARRWHGRRGQAWCRWGPGALQGFWAPPCLQHSPHIP